MLDGRWRTSIEKGLRPVGAKLRRTGVSADVLTAAGMVMAAGAAVAIGLRPPPPRACSCSCSPACPTPSTARWPRPSGTAGPRGSFFDSVADRVSDALLLGGVAWYLADTRPGLMPLLPMAVLGASLIISYERAKAESLGFNAKGGIMERAERIVLLGPRAAVRDPAGADAVDHAGPHPASPRCSGS